MRRIFALNLKQGDVFTRALYPKERFLALVDGDQYNSLGHQMYVYDSFSSKIRSLMISRHDWVEVIE